MPSRRAAELTKRRLVLGLGIDEFQRLLLWGGKASSAALKTSLERHRHLSYVLAGSARSLIEKMVTNRHRALWKATDTLAVGSIPPAAFPGLDHGPGSDVRYSAP